MTNHSKQIKALRGLVENCKYMVNLDESLAGQNIMNEIVMAQAAADLLECHDDAGISLDDWAGPRALVERALGFLERSLRTFTPNGV